MANTPRKRPRAQQTDQAKIVTSGGTIRIEQPKNRRQSRPKIVIMSDDRNPVNGFIDFLREHAVVGLAVGFAIGSQAQTLVKQLVASFIDPVFSLLFGGELIKQTFTWHFHGRHADFGWGGFVYGLLDFLFVLAAIYAIIKLFKLDKLDKPKKT